MIKVNIPSKRGHETQITTVLDGRSLISNHLQKGWLASINGRQIRDPQAVQESDEVNLYPPIMGG